MSDTTPDTSAPTKHGGNILTRKIGHLPVWAYILIFGVLVAAFYWYKKKKEASATSTEPAMTGDQLNTSYGSGTANNQLSPGNGGATTDTSGASTPSSATNAQWAQNAANTLVAQGQDPTTVSNALSAYLDGQSLTNAQQALVNSAIQQNGEPPQGVLPISVSGTSNTSSAPVPYTVVSGDSLVSIAQEFYGDPSQWRNIYAANIGVIGPDPLALHHGEVLQLPAPGLLPTPGPAYTTTGIPSNHLYTVQYGDTLIQLAERFYGNTDWQPIYNANKSKIPNQNELQPGVTLTIPAE
jgi:nucleoid-associated protein YgaU